MQTSARHAELEAWIAASQRMQRKFGVGVATCFAIAFGLMIWNTRIGGLVVALVALVAICGFWVTASHIADWRNRIAALSAPVVRSGSRRWERGQTPLLGESFDDV